MLRNRRPATRHRLMIIVAVVALALVAGADIALPSTTSAQSVPSTTSAPTVSTTVPPTDGASSPLQDRYDEVLGAQAALVTRIDASARRQVELAAQLADLTRATEHNAVDLRTSEAHLADAAATERRGRAALATARTRLTRATDSLHDQAVASYIHGGSVDGVTALVQVFESGPAGGSTLSYVHAVVDHQRQVIVEFNAARAERDRLARSARAARLDATTTRDAILATRSMLATAALRTRALGDEAARQSMIQQAALSELQGKKLEIETRIVGLEKASDGIGMTLAALQATQPDYVPGSITFASPIPGTPVSSPFGMRFHPILHYVRLHAGTDLGAAAGTPLRAAADGEVVIAGPRGGYGNCTVIDHGSGIATVYAHQSAIDVKPGQQVKRGDVIGKVGTTGLSTGPHLHFETRLRGVPVNPTNFVTF